MHFIDWVIVIIPLLAIIFIGGLAQHYTTNVTDFLAAGRGAGRYLLSVADGAAGMGLITIIGQMEMNYNSGYALSFWNQLMVFVSLAMALTGFVSYRYRETRAMTMAEFFEMRYSRKFRIFAGFLAFAAGVVNYAIFPAVGSRFILYYCNFPDYFQCCGITVNTFGFLMAFFLIVALIIVVGGGQLSTMVTDCCQGIFSYFGYAIIIIAILCFFSFVDIEEAILSRPDGMSYFNPFNIEKLSRFNILFVIIAVLAGIYSRNAWLGSQGYMCAAKNPHEQKMAGLLGSWRMGFTYLMIMLIVIGAYTYMNASAYTAEAQAVSSALAERINPATVGGLEQTAITLQKQMLVPIALKNFLPVGVIGVFCAIAIFLLVSTDTTYLHSWGTILVQDVILPIYNKPVSQKVNLLLLRISIVSIAVFAWLFSFYFCQSDFIMLFFALTATIYLGGAGACIIGGLYWKKGTTAGAATAMSIGLICGLVGFVVTSKWEGWLYPLLNKHYPVGLENFRCFLAKASDVLPLVHWDTDPEVFHRQFPISGQEIYFLGILLALTGYILVSLLTCKENFNLDKMLHRGIYNLEHIERIDNNIVQQSITKKIISKLIGITPEYSKGDKIIAWSVLIWTLFNFTVIAVQFLWNVFFGYWSEKTWFNIWKYYSLPLAILVGTVTTIWFTWGGVKDLLNLFRSMRENYYKSKNNEQ